MLVYRFHGCRLGRQRFGNQVIGGRIRGIGGIVDSDRYSARLLFQKIIEGFTVAQGLRTLCQVLVNLDIVLRQVIHQFRGLVEVLADAGLVTVQLVPGRVQFGFYLIGLFN